MTVVNVYLTFNGNCEEAFNFYKSVFGGEFPYLGRFRDMPPGQDHPVAPEDADKIMHVSLPISKETMIMGSDAGGEWSPQVKQGNNFAISIGTDSKDEADRLFNGLSAGGRVTMPLNHTFWGDYFGMILSASSGATGWSWPGVYPATAGPLETGGRAAVAGDIVLITPACRCAGICLSLSAEDSSSL